MKRSMAGVAGMLVLALVAAPAGAQDADEGALGTRLSDFGGFVGLDFRFGDIGGEFAGFAGAEAAILLKRRVYLGVRGAGLATNNHRIPDPAGEPLELGYGGLVLGYVIPVHGPVSLSLDVLGGAGGVGVEGQSGENDWDTVFLFEPSLSVDLALLSVRRFGARIGIGASYRFVGDLDTPGVREQDLRGLAGLIRLRVGRF